MAIPRVAHFIWGLREQDEPFHLIHYLCLESCRRVLQPDGTLYVTTPRRRPERPLGWGHVREYTGDELQSCLEMYFVNVQLTYLWPITWFRLYGTRLGWRLIRLYARYAGNPFTREGEEPEQFAQILAVCHRPHPTHEIRY